MLQMHLCAGSGPPAGRGFAACRDHVLTNVERGLDALATMC
jgi:hypothetical protein